MLQNKTPENRRPPTGPLGAAEGSTRVTTIVFIALLIDLLGFTLILPLLPSILDHYSKNNVSKNRTLFIQSILPCLSEEGAPPTLYSTSLYLRFHFWIIVTDCALYWEANTWILSSQSCITRQSCLFHRQDEFLQTCDLDESTHCFSSNGRSCVSPQPLNFSWFEVWKYWSPKVWGTDKGNMDNRTE